MLKLYKKFISPIFVLLFGHTCRFTPTCSEYASQAINKYGIIRGGLKSAQRIIRCNPFSKAGYDPLI